jgi:putative MATE family efflux protein
VNPPATSVGLCAQCRAVRVQRTRRGSAYYRCARAEEDPQYPRYPRLPVLECRGFETAAPAAAGGAAVPSLLEQPPLRAIARLAAPTTGVMLVATISNILHTYFVSWLGADAIAAVSLVLPIMLILLTFVGGGLGAGVSSAVARALGGGRARDASAIAEHAVAMAVVLAVACTIGFELGGPALFRAMGGCGNVLAQATIFARVFFAGLVIAFTVSTLDSIMRGAGNVRIPAFCATLSLGLQIAFTPLFMFGFGWGLVGAPAATLAGQLIGGIPRVRHLFGRRAPVPLGLWPRPFRRRHLVEILRVGVPASLATLINYAGLMVLTGVVARFGTAHLAAYGLGTRLDFIVFTLGYGVATAALTLIGMAAGARRHDLVARYVWRTAAVVVVVASVPAALVIVRPDLWLGLFSTDADIQAVGARYFRIIAPTYPVIVVAMVLASAFQGIGRAGVPLAVLCARVVIVVAAAMALTRAGAGVGAVFAVIAAAGVLATLTLAVVFQRTVMRHRAGASAAALVVAAALAVDPATAQAVGARFFHSGDGVLRLAHAHFSETLAVRYRDAEGRYDPSALERIAHFFRSRMDGAVGPPSLRLIELLDFVEDRSRPDRIVLVSGYRSPRFNAELRARGGRAAEASLHTEGLAADVQFVGVNLRRLWLDLRARRVGGVGYYADGKYLHLDSGRPRFWEAETSRVAEGLARGNARLFARTDFDRYDSLAGAVVTLHSVTAWPLRVATELRVGMQRLPLQPLDATMPTERGCYVVAQPAAAYRFRVAAAGAVAPGARVTPRLATCPPRVDATPAEIDANPIEAMVNDQ